MKTTLCNSQIKNKIEIIILPDDDLFRQMLWRRECEKIQLENEKAKDFYEGNTK